VRVSDAVDRGLAYLKKDADPTGFVTNAGTTKIPSANLPFFQDTLQGFEPDSMPIFTNEAGLKVIPVGNLSSPADLGLALAPYLKGHITAEQRITDTLKLTTSIDAAATGGTYIAVRPSGMGVAKGGAVNASFEFTLAYARADGSATILVGEAGKTRVETKSVFGTVGGNMTGDLYVAAGLKELKLVIDLREDGFLGLLMPTPLTVDLSSILMGWRNRQGVYFDGGTSLKVTIPINLPVGPIHLHEVAVELAWDDNLQTTVMLTADAVLGPLFAMVENAGLSLTLVPAPNGNGTLGEYDIEFGFRAPTGYAIALDGGAISGGGALFAGDNEYRGALALKFTEVGFSAFAILTTKLPGGVDGFSFAASIFGEFNLPLGYGFFLTGVGGMIGINRTIDTEAMREVLYEGRFDNLLFPPDPIGNARTILADMADILPPMEEQYLFGPVARISWGVPQLVDVKLGVIIELGAQVRMLVLGGLSSSIPTKEVALVVFNLSFFGEIDFAAGTISFNASLQTSRILDWPITGDSAIRTGWGPRINQVASFGGLHPQYPRPSNLPDLRRLSISFGTNNPKVTLSAYCAVTLNSLQFGASADLYAKGPDIPLVGQLAAEGNVHFNALIYFNPFSFDTEFGGSLSLLVDGDVAAGLGFSLRLNGPNQMTIDGKVWVTVCGVDVDFHISHTWGDRKSIPSASVSAVDTLRKALQDSQGFQPVVPRGRSSGVTFRDADDVKAAIDPIGGLSLTQNAVPLQIKIEKIGNATISGVSRVDIALRSGGRSVSADSAEQEFVRGFFFETTEAERLRAPVFEQHKGGVELAEDELAINTASAEVVDYDYEVIVIPVLDNPAHLARIDQHPPLTPSFLDRFMRVTRELHSRPKASYKDLLAPAQPVLVVDQRLVREDNIANLVIELGKSNATVGSVLRIPSLSGRALSKMSDGLTVDKHTHTNMVVADYIAAGRIKR
jgi:hypothetical protein